MDLTPYHNWIERAGLHKKDYQEQGIKWLLHNETRSPITEGALHGGILGDEMGLGKTIQILAVTLCHFKTNTLVVVPHSLLYQWNDVIQRLLGHTPIIYHGTHKNKHTIDDIKHAPLTLTTYGMISTKVSRGSVSHSPLSDISWGRIIYDEAHHLRNPRTRKHKGALTLHSDIVWLVTGTPIQNNASDFNHLCAILRIPSNFLRKPQSIPTIVDQLFLRRTKQSVGLDMPPLSIHNVIVPWKHPKEKKLARNIHSLVDFATPTQDNVDQIINFLGSSKLAIFTRMRQVCILPKLLPTKSKAHTHPFASFQSKIDAVCNTILERKNNKRPKIVFSHFTHEIDTISRILQSNGLNTAYIDGRITHLKRTQIMNSTHYDVVILQIRTASEGLNLQHFKEVYFTSPHWNPFVEDQAIARSHRFGQKDPVDVFRFEMECFSSKSTLLSPEYTLDHYCRIIQDNKRAISMEVLGH